MGALQEREIFDLLANSFAAAADKCKILGWDNRRGHVYVAFLKDIKFIEGCCQQAFAHRGGDARWLTIGFQMGEVHKRSGHWLRNSPTKETRVEADKRFKKLGEVLLKLARESEDMRDKATGKIGMILPDPLPGPHRPTRPVQVMTPGGLILPPGTKLN